MNIIRITLNIRFSGYKASLTCSGFQLVKEKSCSEGQMELFSWERCSPAGRNSTERQGVSNSAEETQLGGTGEYYRDTAAAAR